MYGLLVDAPATLYGSDADYRSRVLRSDGGRCTSLHFLTIRIMWKPGPRHIGWVSPSYTPAANP